MRNSQWWLRLLWKLGAEGVSRSECYSDCGIMPWGVCRGHRRIEYGRERKPADRSATMSQVRS